MDRSIWRITPIQILGHLASGLFGVVVGMAPLSVEWKLAIIGTGVLLAWLNQESPR